MLSYLIISGRCAGREDACFGATEGIPRSQVPGWRICIRRGEICSHRCSNLGYRPHWWHNQFRARVSFPVQATHALLTSLQLSIHLHLCRSGNQQTTASRCGSESDTWWDIHSMQRKRRVPERKKDSCLPCWWHHSRFDLLQHRYMILSK